MKQSAFVLAGLALLLTGGEALALSDSEAQQFYNTSSQFRNADKAMKAAWNTIMKKGTPAEMAALRDSQKEWLKNRDSTANSMTGLKPAERHALVIKARVKKMEAFVRQSAAGEKPIILEGAVRRLTDAKGKGWGVCQPVEVDGGSLSACFLVAHDAFLPQDSPLRAALTKALAEKGSLAVSGCLKTPEGFEERTVKLVEKPAATEAKAPDVQIAAPGENQAVNTPAKPEAKTPQAGAAKPEQTQKKAAQ